MSLDVLQEKSGCKQIVCNPRLYLTYFPHEFQLMWISKTWCGETQSLLRSVLQQERSILLDLVSYKLTSASHPFTGWCEPILGKEWWVVCTTSNISVFNADTDVRTWPQTMHLCVEVRSSTQLLPSWVFRAWKFTSMLLPKLLLTAYMETHIAAVDHTYSTNDATRNWLCRTKFTPFVLQ